MTNAIREALHDEFLSWENELIYYYLAPRFYFLSVNFIIVLAGQYGIVLTAVLWRSMYKQHGEQNHTQ